MIWDSTNIVAKEDIQIGNDVTVSMGTTVIKNIPYTLKMDRCSC
jgi:hypothetical protein